MEKLSSLSSVHTSTKVKLDKFESSTIYTPSHTNLLATMRHCPFDTLLYTHSYHSLQFTHTHTHTPWHSNHSKCS